MQKALGRYRQRIGLDGPTDFHSTRRNLARLLENAKVYPLAAQRYMGHKPEDLTFGLYAGKGEPEALQEVALLVHYPAPVEDAMWKALGV